MVVSQDHLKKIDVTLKKRIGVPKYSASCAGELDIEFSDVKELIQYENAKSTKLQSLRIRAKSDDWEKEARVSLRDSEFQSLEVEVTGSLQTAPRHRDELGEIFEGSKAWYWPVYKVNFIAVVIALYFLLLVSVNIWKIIEKGTIFWEAEKSSGSSSGGSFFLILLVFAVAVLLNRIRNFLFPRMAFSIGQEVRRLQVLEKIQWGVVVAFLVSLFAGAFLNAMV